MTERRRVPTQDQLVKREEKRQRWFSVAASLNDRITGELPGDYFLINLHSLGKERDSGWEKACSELTVPQKTFILQVIGAALRAGYTEVGDFREPRPEVPATEKPLNPFYEEMLTRLFAQPKPQQ